MALSNSEQIGIYVGLGSLLFVILVCASCWLFGRRKGGQATFQGDNAVEAFTNQCSVPRSAVVDVSRSTAHWIVSHPPEGVYASPLTVRLQSLRRSDNEDIYVRVATAGVQGEADERTQTSGVSGLMKYDNDLVFTIPGKYFVLAHTPSAVDATGAAVGAVCQFEFTVTAEDSTGRSLGDQHHTSTLLQRPIIVPERGEITDLTPIVLTHELLARQSDGSSLPSSIGDLSLWYAIGDAPFCRYCQPFCLDMLHFQRQDAEVTVLAKATRSSPNLTSDVTEAKFKVVRGRYPCFDPDIPAPSLQVLATSTVLYFDTPPTPNEQIYYCLQFVSTARKDLGNDLSSLQGAVVRTHRPGEVVDLVWTRYQGAVRLSCDVRRISACTVLSSLNYSKHVCHSAFVHYDVALLDRFSTLSNELPEGFPQPLFGSLNSALRPPAPCVACDGLELRFDDPRQGRRVLYTLNGTDPSTSDSCEEGSETYEAREGLLRLLRGEVGSVTLTARLFDNTSNNYGHKFSRTFQFQEDDAQPISRA